MNKDDLLMHHDYIVVQMLSQRFGFNPHDVDKLPEQQLDMLVKEALKHLHDAIVLNDEAEKDQRINNGALGMDDSFVLLCAENHNGWKLEELLAKLQAEVAHKTTKVIENQSDVLAQLIVENNRKTIELLGQAESLQRMTNNILNMRGASDVNNPRVGSGKPNSYKAGE